MAFVMRDKAILPSRVRSAWVPNELIRAMAVEYAPVLKSKAVTLNSGPAAGPVVASPTTHEFPLVELQAPASEPQAEPAKPDRGRHVPMNPSQKRRTDAEIEAMRQGGHAIHHAVVTIEAVPMSNNAQALKNGIAKHRHKGQLQEALEVQLDARGLARPLVKDGQLICAVTYRFGDKRQREVQNLDIFRKALGDALRRSKAPSVVGELADDSDVEWTVLSEEIRRSAGFVGSTVRMWWREP